MNKKKPLALTYFIRNLKRSKQTIIKHRSCKCHASHPTNKKRNIRVARGRTTFH